MRLPTIAPNQRPRPSRAGFSIIEALVAAAVLGIGMVGLVKLHTSSIRGMQKSRDINVAQDIATQAAEEVAALGGAAISGGTGVGACFTNAAVSGCRAGSLNPTQFATPRAVPCTLWVGDQGKAGDASGFETLPLVNTEAAAVPLRRRFRVDRVITRHPSPNQDTNTRVIDVFVCWRDESGVVRELQSTRVAL